MTTFSEWAKLEETKGVKKAKIAPVAHTDIDRWLKSVDGLAKDLSDLKQAKEKTQSKLDQIKKKYEPAEKPTNKPVDKPTDKQAVDDKSIEPKQKDGEPDSKPVKTKVKLKPEELKNDEVRRKPKRMLDIKPPTKRIPVRRVARPPQQDNIE